MRSVADLGDRLARRLDRISCRELTEAATEHLEGALPRRAERRVLAHLRRCASCRRYLAQLRATVSTLGRLPADAVDGTARQRLVSAMRSAARRD